eukprot:SAG11_NODE_6396_length_1322_cov_1.013083_2_plen_153_part_00
MLSTRSDRADLHPHHLHCVTWATLRITLQPRQFCGPLLLPTRCRHIRWCGQDHALAAAQAVEGSRTLRLAELERRTPAHRMWVVLVEEGAEHSMPTRLRTLTNVYFGLMRPQRLCCWWLDHGSVPCASVSVKMIALRTPSVRLQLSPHQGEA